ncbi:MAG: septum formation initiator family protein [Urechidicola sp.]|nr:septum formation initiator family protein [Urechidicola sp.]
MTLKQIRNNKTVRFLSNRYVLILIVFLIWMTFFDENSFLIDREFNKEINKLETDKNFYQTEINADKKKIEKLEDPEQLDKYAREEYNMKKENEDIYIIEYDTIQ